jgi:hypothetical protein
VGRASPRGLLPLLQFTRPSESLSGRGIVSSVRRSPLGLRRDGVTLGVFPRPPARPIEKKVAPLSWTSLCSRVPSRAGPPEHPVATLPNESGPCDELSGHSPGVCRPYSVSSAGSDLRRGCLPRLCSAFGLPRTLDALLRPTPCRPCFMPTTLMGFPLQRFPLPVAHATSRSRFPSRRSRASDAARTRRLRSSLRRALSPSGVRVPPGIRSSDQGGLASWLEPILSWVFHPSRVLPPTALTLPSKRLLPCPLSPARRSERGAGTPESCVAAGWAGLSRGCRPS